MTKVFELQPAVAFASERVTITTLIQLYCKLHAFVTRQINFIRQNNFY